MLEVVEQEQQVATAQSVLHSRAQRLSSDTPEPHGLCDRGRDMVWAPKRGQGYKPYAISVCRCQALSDAQGKPCLPHSTGSGQCDEPNILAVQKVNDGGLLGFSPQEGCEVGGKPVSLRMDRGTGRCAARPRDCPFEHGFLLRGETQRAAQQCHGVAPWLRAGTAFQIANGSIAQPCPLCKFLLREPSGLSIVPQECPKGVPLLRCHRANLMGLQRIHQDSAIVARNSQGCEMSRNRNCVGKCVSCSWYGKTFESRLDGRWLEYAASVPKPLRTA